MRTDKITLIRIFIVTLIALVVLLPTPAFSQDNNTFVGAWRVKSPQDVVDLQKQGFNLFFINSSDYAGMSFGDRNHFIGSIIDVLRPCDKIVLNIQNFLTCDWAAENGMQEFVYHWGGHEKVYGFFLKDDFMVTPLYKTDGSADELGLYKLRWRYKKIRNADGYQNKYNTDLAPGKSIIVSWPFGPYAVNGHPDYKEYKFAINEVYRIIDNNGAVIYRVPPNITVPGEAWDIVMPYWYPHRRGLSDIERGQYMDTLYLQMHQLFPDSTIPIMQSATEPDGCGENSLDEVPNFSVQYNKLYNNGLMNDTKAVVYYTANGHAEVDYNLLWWDGYRDISSDNLYYNAVDEMNKVHYARFGMPQLAAIFEQDVVSGIAPLIVNFTNLSQGIITHYLWDFGDGCTSSSEWNPVHEYVSSGTYTVTLTVTGLGGCSDIACRTIHVSEAPIAGFTASTTSGAAPLKVQFTDTSTGSRDAWLWEFGDGATSNERSPAQTYEAVGKYTVRLTVSGPGGEDAEEKVDYIEVTYGCAYEKTITIDHTKVAAKLAGFPLLVNMIEPTLRHISQGGGVISEGGYDIVFFDDQGRLLSHEVEYYDNSTGKLVAWVRIPCLSAEEDTTIYMRYGSTLIIDSLEDKADLWGADFQLVTHMQTGYGNHIRESSMYENEIVKKTNDGETGILPIEVGGKIGMCQYNITPDNYLKVIPGQGWVEHQQEHSDMVSFSAWMYVESCATDMSTIVAYRQHEKGLSIDNNTDQSSVVCEFKETGYGSKILRKDYRDSDDIKNRWIHIAGVTDTYENMQYLYIDGELASQQELDGGTIEILELLEPSYELTIMGSLSPDTRFSGKIDEVRIEQVSRGPEWWRTIYNNQNDPDSFYTIE